MEITPAAPKGRIEWIDDVKGLAIVLVVYGHVMQGAVASGIIPDGRSLTFSDAFVYSFHMPAFFFISGLLSAKALARSMGKYVHDRAATIAWPYLVWVVLGLLAFSIFGRFYHHPVVNPWHAFLVCLWDPGAFWFLHVLFCIQMVMVLTIWLPIEVICGLSLVGFFLSGYVATIPALERVLFFLPFFAVGVWSATWIAKITEWTGSRGYAGAALFFTFQAVTIGVIPHPWMAWTLVWGFTGTLGLILLSLGAARTLFSHVVGRIGAASLGVFLLHPYFQGLSRAVMDHVFNPPAVISVVVQVLVAVIVPVFLYEWMMTNSLRYLFTLKREQKKPAE